MAYTLSNLLWDAYTLLGQAHTTQATGGTTLTALDSKLVGEGKNDDWNNGVLFVLRDAGGASAAPEGEFQRVSDYADNTGTFTVDTAFSAAIASGDRIGYTTPRWSLYEMKELVNLALSELGDLDFVDTTTLDTADDQTEYAASVTWKRTPPKRVDVQTVDDDTNDNRWYEIKDWEYVPAAGGSTGLIIFPYQLIADYGIRVWYIGAHPELNAYSDVVDERIHPSVARWATVVQALKTMNARTQGDEESIKMDLMDARQELDNALNKHPIWKVPRKSKLFTYPQSTTIETINTTVP